MELIDLYKEENQNLLYSISWLNKNSIFDKSIGTFQDIDLFTFLENINKFDYDKDIFYDDVYYILEYTQDTILHLLSNINKEIKREHKIVPISQAKEFDNKSVLWISRKDGRTLKEKLSKGKIKTVKRYKNIDTYENRILKKLLIKLVYIYESRSDLEKFEHLFIKVRRWLKSDDAKNIDEYKKVVYNNILLHHPHYSKIFKSFKWFNSLNEKVNSISHKLDENISYILLFNILSRLQLNSKELVLPSDIDINIETFKINFNPKWIIGNINILNISNNKKELFFKNIPNLTNTNIKKQLDIKLDKNRVFQMELNAKEIYIDLFRLFPIARIDNQTIKFPITLKQKVDNKIVNANNTKVIDLNNEIYTLPEILDNFDTNILKYFLDDFKRYFDSAKLNYIIPDYINVFEFTISKKMINSYFKNNKPIPKSILVGLQYIFHNNVKENDTLIYIQRNHHNELYVTPLLVKYNKKLKDITNGFYLERYPTKKLDKYSSRLLKSLNNAFDDKTSNLLLNKFLQNGLKGIKKENIVFYKDNNIIDLNNFEIPHDVFNDISKIKKLYNSQNLFKTNHKFLKDINEENLINFEKLLQYENQGHNLWREHLPDLSMEIVKNGVYEQFILVNETSELIEKTVKIENHFLIPHGIKELSFPLTFGDEKINYKAYLSSKDFPYSQNIECRLNLTYDYERENPYELIFIPLNKEHKEINVEWKQQSYNDIELPIPNYPEKKSWNDFKYFINKKGDQVNLLDWLTSDLEKIIEIQNFYMGKSTKIVYKENINFDWFTDRTGFYASRVTIPAIGEVFFHEKNYEYFDINLNNLTFELEESRQGGYQARNISVGKQIPKNIISTLRRSYRFPLITIFNNGSSLADIEVSNEFRQLIYNAIESALYIYHHIDSNILKNEMLYFLSCINSNTHEEIGDLLASYSNKYSTFERYLENLAYSMGHLQLKWQQNIFKNTIKYLKSENEEKYSDALKLLGIVAWRYDSFILKTPNNIMDIIVQKLYNSLNLKVKYEIIYFESRNGDLEVKKSVLIRLELLLALLRYRLRDKDFLHPMNKITVNYVNLINNIVNKVISKDIKFISRVQLNINKPESLSNTPDILYALRVYLTADTGAANSIKVLGVSDD
jgi:uncharacterized protein YbcV (DUF1398 family)